MRRLLTGLLLLVVATACGSASVAARPSPSLAGTATPAANTSPSPSLSPRPLLFAALEVKGGNAWNVLAIAGLDGYARAKTNFTPLPAPFVGCAGSVPPASAHVAAGKVYFADGAGVIRTLNTTGQIATIAAIPYTGHQQMLSFAVSPDGSQLLASVFTLPPQATPGSDPCAGPAPFGPGDFMQDVYSANPGAATHLLYHRVLATSFGQPISTLAFVGWDKLGPEATYPTEWATQGGGPHPYGTLVRVDASTGNVVRQVDNPQSCLVWDIAAGGDYVCTNNAGGISVRRPDATEIWGVAAPSNSQYWAPYLSPGEDKVATGATDNTIVSSDGSQSPLGLNPLGWLNETTIIGGGFGVHFTYAKVDRPGTAIDIGFTGMFVGTVQS
jgi:hypothetical protein